MTRLQLINLVYATILSGLMLGLIANAHPVLGDTGRTETGTRSGKAGDIVDAQAPAALVGNHLEAKSDLIRLGDLFTNAGKYKDRVIARAPEPGQTSTLDAVWLWKVARGYGIDWRPTSTFDSINLTRPSRLVSTADLKNLVRQAIFEQTGQDELIEIDLDNNGLQLHLSQSTTGAPQIRNFQLDKSSGRFSALITGPSGSDERRTVTLAGRAVEQVEVSVPTQRLRPGHIIRARDLETIALPITQVSRTALIYEEDMIGLEASRTLSAGRPIASASLRPPEMVSRNASVTITLETGTMRLTATGRAMENGAEGDLVRVQNLQSRVTIDAIVTGPNRVRASLPARLAAHGDVQ